MKTFCLGILNWNNFKSQEAGSPDAYKSGNDIATSNPNTLSQQSPQFTNTVSTRKQSMTPKERFYANKDYLLKYQLKNKR